jgi:diacylglycerol kinase family enzyme
MNEIKKWVFIINPVAGDGFAPTLVGKIKEMIQKHQLQADIVFTAKKGHASALSKQYAENGYTYIIGVGGDGTINEIAAPLICKKDVIAGLIPGGTGNDFIQIYQGKMLSTAAGHISPLFLLLLPGFSPQEYFLSLSFFKKRKKC